MTAFDADLFEKDLRVCLKQCNTNANLTEEAQRSIVRILVTYCQLTKMR